MNLISQSIGNKYAVNNSPEKIVPYRIIELFDEFIYEFWRVGSKNRSDIHNRSTPKEMAMIVIKKDLTTFTIHYCPLDKENVTVIDNLPISELRNAVRDLKNAGF